MRYHGLDILGLAMILSWSSHANTTSYSYDAKGRLIQIADSAGNKNDYTLDAAGNRTNVADQSANALAPQIVSFTAPSQVASAGSYATLNWASSNATACKMTVNGALDYPALAATGTLGLPINAQSTLVLSCVNGALTASMTRIVRIRSVN